MRQWLRAHLTYANVMVTILAFIVLGGTAVAAFVVSSNSQIGPDTIYGHKAPAGANKNIIAGSVNGQDVADNSLAGADIAASALPKGRKVTSACDPSSFTFVDCGTMTINLPRSGLRVLIVASATWSSFSGAAKGTCRIGVNGAPFGPDVFPGNVTDTTSYLDAESSVTLTNVTDPNLGAGSHTFGLACNERSGNIVFDRTMVSAVVLGPG